MNNRIITLIVVSLFLLIPHSTYAQEGDSGSEESKPDYIVEPVWDDDIPWSDYLGKPVENIPQFKIKNIGGPLTASEEADCRENCNYWIIINEGKEDARNITYNIATWNESYKDSLFDNGELITNVLPRIFGGTDLKVCFDYENPDSVVDESNETNNCWEGTIDFYPDLRWFEGNPNGSFEVRLGTIIDYGYNETLGYMDSRRDPIEAANDVWITDNGWVRIDTAYMCGVNGSAGPCSYDGNFIQMNVTIDGEEVASNYPFWTGVDASYRIENTSVVRLCFDPENLIEETNEDNNCIEKTLVNASYVPDSDNDGVKDDRDLCLGTSEGEVVSPFGCPDSDGDGYWDNQDICADGDDGVDEDNDDIPDACDDLIDVGETSSEDDSSRLPGPSFILTIGMLAFAAITYRNQRMN